MPLCPTIIPRSLALLLFYIVIVASGRSHEKLVASTTTNTWDGVESSVISHQRVNGAACWLCKDHGWKSKRRVFAPQIHDADVGCRRLNVNNVLRAIFKSFDERPCSVFSPISRIPNRRVYPIINSYATSVRVLDLCCVCLIGYQTKLRHQAFVSRCHPAQLRPCQARSDTEVIQWS